MNHLLATRFRVMERKLENLTPDDAKALATKLSIGAWTWFNICGEHIAPSVRERAVAVLEELEAAAADLPIHGGNGQ